MRDGPPVSWAGFRNDPNTGCYPPPRRSNEVAVCGACAPRLRSGWMRWRLGVKSCLACGGYITACVTLACVLAPSAPARGVAVPSFREVASQEPPNRLAVGSDGVRFAWTNTLPSAYGYGKVRVFDTLRGRSFRLRAPARGCQIGGLRAGADVVLWDCPPPRETLITYLETGRTREPAGIEKVRAMDDEYTVCEPAYGFGRYWIQVWCGARFGGGGGPDLCCYLNHRTGELTHARSALYAEPPLLDLDYAGLVRSLCAPLGRAADVREYQPPLALEAPGLLGPVSGASSLRLRRCGTKRAELLSRCRPRVCRTPQLGSRYVTWGEDRRVYAYLPRIRRRVLLGRFSGELVRRRRLIVAHTCNRVFVRWGFSVYVTRFEPRHGAPPCQSKH